MSGRYPLLKFVVFAAVCAVFAAWLVMMIGNLDPFQATSGYEAVFEDATGLLANDEVKISGVPVGRVEDVHLERGRAVVNFSVRDDIALGDETTVGIRWRGIIGLRFLYLYPDGEGELEEGHRFPPERTFAPASVAEALERITPVMRALEPEVQNRMMEALQEALVGQEEEIQRLIDETGDLTHTLASRDAAIGRLLENGAVLMDSLAARDDQVRRMIETFANTSETVAARNDEIEAIITQLADAQAELRRMVEVNDGDIRGALDALDDITAILAVSERNLEDVLKYSGEGIVSYHLISRWGQWFNIRIAGASEGENTFTTERGAELPPRRSREGGAQSTSSSLADLFGNAPAATRAGGGT